MEEILQEVDIVWVQNLGQCCRILRIEIRFYVIRRLHRTISPWIKDPLDFRQILYRTHSVISGSIAIKIALGAQWEPGDMDIYVPRRKTAIVVDYLRLSEGFDVMQQTVASVDPNNQHASMKKPVAKRLADGTYYFVSGIKSVTKLIKLVRVDNKTVLRYIDVMESKDHSSITPIFRFHATWSMNWITANSIHVAYPQFTINKLGICRRPRYNSVDTVKNWKRRYEARGFCLVKRANWLWPGVACGDACRAIIRRSNDEGCLTFSLQGDDAETIQPCYWTFVGPRGSQACTNRACPRYGLTVWETGVLNRRSIGQILA